MDINGEEFFESAHERRSPVYRFAAENSQVQRLLYVREDPLTPARVVRRAHALLGSARVDSDLGGVNGRRRYWVARQTPAAFRAESTPDNPSATDFLYCTSIPSVEPWSKPAGVDVGRSFYKAHKFSSVWESLPYDVRPDAEVRAQAGAIVGLPDEGDCLRRGWANTRYVTKIIDPGSQIVSLRQGLMRWAEAPAGPPIHEGWAHPTSKLVVNYVWHCVPVEAVPLPTIQRQLNSINDGEFDGFPTWTMLFTDCKLRHYRSAFGQRICDVNYRFAYKPGRDPVDGVYLGWVALIRVLGGKLRYWPVTTDGLTWNPNAPNLPFPTATMESLFRPEQP